MVDLINVKFKSFFSSGRLTISFSFFLFSLIFVFKEMSWSVWTISKGYTRNDVTIKIPALPLFWYLDTRLLIISLFLNELAILSFSQEGRADREKPTMKPKRQNPFASTTNKEKAKKKNFMMLKQKAKGKQKRSFKDKQVSQLISVA